jgi:hypothetical protein
MPRRAIVSSLAVLLMLGACASVPDGPSRMALPGTGKSFDRFRADDYECRQYASAQIGGTSPDQAAVDSGVRSAALGTAVGAIAGAAIDGHHGAGVGAGVGLLIGALAGSGAAQSSAYSVQRRYDAAYIPCMYAKGHKVPVPQGFTASAPPAAGAPPYPPPPPSPYR